MILAAALLIAAAPAPAAAHAGHAAAAPCPAVPAPLAPPLAGWSRGVPVSGGTRAAAAPTLAIGVGARAALPRTGAVAYRLSPRKPGTAADHGGLFGFAAPAAGRYRVALGSAAWIDVVDGAGRAAVSVAHDHGPACSGIRKMVDFDLAPGRYLLQVAGDPGATLPLMVTRLR